ncbi:MAG: YitT family protein [Oscillospiraceae bacterium]|nr:YitT family protein [Oscillospiraceae bacterium]
MKQHYHFLVKLAKSALGCIIFAIGFNLFLEPNGLNAGGISGLAMVFVSFTKLGTVGILTAIVNIPLFFIAAKKISKNFLVYSLFGMFFNSLFIDMLAILPRPNVDPLLSALYGGALCGVGLGLVFTTGGSTGGSDIIVRLLKLKWPNISIGVITISFDFFVAALTGFVFRDIRSMLYSGVAIFISGQVIDAVVYRFDYSKVALIISSHYEDIARQITQVLERGVTYLHGEGCYSHKDTKVILTAVKRHQLAELKQLVSEIDPDAFVILQEAHQVLGDGFSRYSKDIL